MFAFEIKFPTDNQSREDVCLAAADEVTRQRCMRIIEAASAYVASSSLCDIASSAALTPGLFMMRSLRAVNAVLAALGRPAVAALDAPSLKAAGFDCATCVAAGCNWSTIRIAGFTAVEVKASGCDPASAQAAGYDMPSLVAAYGYDAVEAAGVVSCVLVSFLLCSCARTPAQTDYPLTPPPFPQRDGTNLYMTLHCHTVDVGTLVEDGKKPLHVPTGWQIAAGDADDARVCGAHPWQSICLVFANGDAYGTSMCDPSYIGKCPQRSYIKINFSPQT